MGSPWYSIEGHPAPFEGNFDREKRIIVQLRLRNATFGHLEQAVPRISSAKVEVGKVNTPRGVLAGLAVTETDMTMEDIDEVIKQLKLHLGSIINARDTVSEIISRRKYVSQRLAASKDSGHYFNRPPYR